MKDYPIFLTTRDRVSGLRDMVDWLERAGHEEIYFVDNLSTYPPLLEYFESSPHTLIQTGKNLGTNASWKAGIVPQYASNRYYVVSDPDIVPTEECPIDALHYFHDVLERDSRPFKIAFSVLIDDIPDMYEHKADAIKAHNAFWDEGKRIENNFFSVLSDGIMAMYRPNSKFGAASWRSDKPYSARHSAWYIDSSNPTKEYVYYREHASKSKGAWSWETIPGWLRYRLDNPNWKKEKKK